MDVWHARLGHIRKEVLTHVPYAVDGVALSTKDFERTSELCPECQLGQAQQQISRLPIWNGTYPFEKVHMDIIHMEEAFNMSSWITHFYCDYSGYHISFNTPFRTQQTFVSILKEFLAITNKNWGFKTRFLHTDNDTGFREAWDKVIKDYGITHTKSPPHTPSQNGPAERSGG